MTIREENKAAYYRPADRRLASLTNEELQALFELRAAKVKVDPKGLWENNRIVYWETMMPLLSALYEVMLEIQARYPQPEICKYGEAGHFDKTLPLREWQWISVADAKFREGREPADATRRGAT